MTTARTVLIIAALTLREASRRRVLSALAALTVLLLVLSGWGFSRVAAESGLGTLTSGEARLVASQLLNLVMFGFSLIAALGSAFLAGPTLSGETESGIALRRGRDGARIHRWGSSIPGARASAAIDAGSRSLLAGFCRRTHSFAADRSCR